MDKEQLIRYSRHLLLPQITIDAQQDLLNSHVLLIGLGGLGSPAAMYLASSGAGHLTLCDSDKVDLSNLQRQIIHTTKSIGLSKCASAANTLRAINPDVTISTLEQHLDGNELDHAINNADIVIDASDNFNTRFAINASAVKYTTPLVSGAMIRMQGMITTLRPDIPNSPCYQCLFDPDGQQDAGNCQDSGVFAPGVGIIGSLMAAEALKILLGINNGLYKKLLTVDMLTSEFKQTNTQQDPACPICNAAK